MKTYKLEAILRDIDGAVAVEFALCSMAFLAMVFGGMYASMLGFASASLHNAVESAARCRAMGITCTDATTTQNFAAAKYKKITGATPTFISDTQACGNRVQGSVNLKLNWVLSSSTVKMQATSCFPTQTAS
jgi:Flp pilus assembly protein TadG